MLIYDGHPNLHCVDVSVLGWWGEGGNVNGGEGFRQATNRLIDVYLRSFKKTPLVALINGYQSTYATSKGTGWRADSFGDVSSWRSGSNTDEQRWNHMFDYYPMRVCEAKAQESWRDRPVIMECGWVPRMWFNEGFDFDWIVRQGLYPRQPSRLLIKPLRRRPAAPC